MHDPLDRTHQLGDAQHALFAISLMSATFSAALIMQRYWYPLFGTVGAFAIATLGLRRSGWPLRNSL